METFSIKSTTDFRQIWPHLKRTDRFKRAIDVLFEQTGAEFTVKVQPEGTSFVNKSKNRYQTKIIYNGMRHLTQYKWWQCGRWQVTPASWALIGRSLGLLLKDEIISVEDCSGCQGTGRKPQFMHIANGLCFDCLGVGKWFNIPIKKT